MKSNLFTRKNNNYYVTYKNKNILFKHANEKHKKYLIHDNGGIPFTCYVSPNVVLIYLTEINDKLKKPTIGELIFVFSKYKNIFIGRNKQNKLLHFGKKISNLDSECKTAYLDILSKKFEEGNSILIEIDTNKYVFVSSVIQTFKTKEKIINYFSPIGNNDVPYVYALSDKYTYLLSEMSCIENINRTSMNPYDQLYGWCYKKNTNKKRERLSYFTKMKYQIMYERRR